MNTISKKRKEMGEEAWAEYQKKRKLSVMRKYLTTDKAKRNQFAVSEFRRNCKLKLIEYKGGKCSVCGYNKQIPGAYDFHHLDPNEKDFGIGEGRTRSFESLKAEVDKCILVCRNCHAEIHHNIQEEANNKIKKEVGLI